jgi:tetratricopeptide (TPR) repeat protein
VRNISESDEELIRYLLGDLEDSRRDDLEDRFFADDALHDQLLAVEDELVDFYVRDELPPQQRKRFEDWFLRSADRREKVKFARNLSAYQQAHLRADSLEVTSRNASSADPTLAKKPTADGVGNDNVGNDNRDRPKGTARSFSGFWHSWKLSPQLAFSSAALVVLLLAVTIVQRSVPPEQTAQNKPTPPQAGQVEKTPGPTPVVAPKSKGAEPREKADPPMILALALSPVQRGSAADGNTLKIPSGSSSIRLDLALPSNDYQEYTVRVENLGTGKTVVRGGLRPESAAGVLKVTPMFSSPELPPGDYVVRLMRGGANATSADAVAGYSFRTVPNGEAVQKFAKKLAELENGNLIVEVNLESVEISVDGQPYGVARPGANLRVPGLSSGIHKIKGARKGYEPVLIEVNVPGTIQLDSRDYPEVVRQLQRAALEDPKNSFVQSLLAEAMYSADRPKEAEAAANQAISLDGSSARAYLIRGEARRSQKRFDEAMTDYRQALQLQEHGSAVLRVAAYWAVGTGMQKNHSGHRPLYRSQGAAAYYGLCASEIGKEDYHQAVAYCKRAVAIDKEDTDSHLMLAESYAALFSQDNRRDYLLQSKENIEAALRINPNLDNAPQLRSKLKAITEILTNLR